MEGINRPLGISAPEAEKPAMLTKKLATYRRIDVLGKPVDLVPQMKLDAKWDQLMVERITMIINFLKEEENYRNSKLSIDDLAKHISISIRQLQESMRKFLGCYFTDLLSAIRLKKALELLQKGTRPSVVAFEVGFNSHAYFSTRFKKTFHITPDEYRRGYAAAKSSSPLATDQPVFQGSVPKGIDLFLEGES